jgi:hypothetical protein
MFTMTSVADETWLKVKDNPSTRASDSARAPGVLFSLWVFVGIDEGFTPTPA